MNHEDTLSKMNEGRTAQVCLEWMQPMFEQCEKNIVANLKRVIREGKFNETILASGVASLVAIEDLQSMLRATINSGAGASKLLEDNQE